MTITPYVIELILHYRCSASPWSREDAPIFESTVEALVRDGILQPRPAEAPHLVSDWMTTPKGNAWVEMLCATPWPVGQFVDPRFPVKNLIHLDLTREPETYRLMRENVIRDAFHASHPEVDRGELLRQALAAVDPSPAGSQSPRARRTRGKSRPRKP